MPSQQEIDRRYQNIRSRMERDRFDALIVCGNQYAGFEGATSLHFRVRNRAPLRVHTASAAGEPTLVFPREARWIGDKKKPWIKTRSGPMFRGAGCASAAQERRLETSRGVRHGFRHGRTRLSRAGTRSIRDRAL